MKTIKNKMLLCLTLLPILALLIIGTVVLATAEAPTPSVGIAKFNLTFENNIYIKYAVKLHGVENVNSQNFKLLIWNDPQAAYEKGSEDTALTSTGTQTVSGELYHIFSYTDLAAKQMAEDVYARACYEVGGNIYYSEVEKYSILQYAYNKLGITGTASTNENFKTLLCDMLEYGASSQKYFDYKTDRLANADFRQIEVEGGKLPDGSDQGLYIIGEQISLTANATNAEGIPFAYWKNSADTKVGTDLTYTATVGEKNETYTAVYEGVAATPDAYFTFTLLDNGTYAIEAKDVKKMPAETVIPQAYNNKAVTTIASNAFYGCTGLTSITIPDSVTSIGFSAFQGCTGLTSITVPFVGEAENGTSNTYFGYIFGASSCFANQHYVPTSLKNVVITGETKIYPAAFRNCKELTSITIPDSVTSIGYTAFSGCTGLIQTENGVSYVNRWVIDCEASATDAVLRENTVGIASDAFSYCTSLTTLTIPNSVKEINQDAFYGCSAFSTVYYTGTASEWSAIAISNVGNTQLTSATIYYYSETQPTEEGNHRHCVDGVPTAW